jgi:hypothetical protein
LVVNTAVRVGYTSGVRAAGIAIAIASLGHPAIALGAPSYSLSWIRLPGAEMCISTGELGRKVEQKLQRRGGHDAPVLVSAAAADLAIEGRVEPREGSGFRAVVVVTSSGGAVLGDRTVESTADSCAQIEEPLALIVALLIDAEAARVVAPAPTLSAPPPPPPPAPALPAPPPAAALAAPRLRLEAQVAPSLSLGVVPGLGPGLGVHAVFGIDGGFAGRLGAEFAWGSEALAGSSEVLVRLAGGSLAVCRMFGGAQIGLDLCAGVELGALSAQPRGLAGSADQESLWAVPELLASAAWHPIAPLAIRLGLTLGAPVVRDRFTYQDGSSVREAFVPSVVIGRVSLGIGVFLP